MGEYKGKITFKKIRGDFNMLIHGGIYIPNSVVGAAEADFRRSCNGPATTTVVCEGVVLHKRDYGTYAIYGVEIPEEYLGIEKKITQMAIYNDGKVISAAWISVFINMLMMIPQSYTLVIVTLFVTGCVVCTAVTENIARKRALRKNTKHARRLADKLEEPYASIFRYYTKV